MQADVADHRRAGRPVGAAGPSTADRILDVSLPLFARKGFAGVSLEEVGVAAGIRRASVLYHFQSKEVLYGRVVDRSFRALTEELRTAMGAHGDLQRSMAATVGAWVGYLEKNPDFARLLLRELVAEQGPGHILLQQRVVPLLDMVATFFGPSSRSALVMVASNALLSAAAGTLREPIWGRAEEVARMGRQMLASVLPRGGAL
ncbi:MAG TPA: TetR/AcrR family transcriptional regulator [Myxococcota bacterium]|nr:TetR/AcrR family transcriptional regulator [Myxococcota bacterium]HNH50032.1 TetR/AcrR family transcriptional regulator [Myxococcota bacterium]